MTEADAGSTREATRGRRVPVSEWEGHEPEPLSSEEFEAVWGLARCQIAARPS
ncbi:hypothetical protein SVEN_3689 [Streptomyces venezuelae ATCC 10712]|uniref:Uncharacterized protein n=1 Tax=Streptomyces venezuelae (strain ATCC 10712 / CBS 650.69 / DSM 40230 / JCM 4526 / NBRC 13096 / PD 04745) TaxID=953739 RepID=F2RD79_STRVP|nr:hypothetical protein SVEN_3689 [Streptomyces venezuelae ATCC 10712]